MNVLSRFSASGRKKLLSTARIVGVVVLLELAALAAWSSISQSGLGRLELVSERAILTVEVLDESGELPIGDPITVVKQATLTLPDGEYRLRVGGEGLLGRTYRATVNRGETIVCKLSLDEGRLLGGDRNPSNWNGDMPREDPRPFAFLTAALPLVPGKADFVEHTGQTIIRRDGVSGDVIWDAASPRSSYDRQHDPGPWLRRIERDGVRLSLAEPVADLDGDGTRDVVFVEGSTIHFTALSGKDGSKIWDHAGERPGTAGPRKEAPEPREPVGPASRLGDVVGQTWIDDFDADGAPELIATLAFHESAAEFEKRTGSPISFQTRALTQRVVQAISGRTGRVLWSFLVDPAYTTIKAQYWGKPATLVRGSRSSVVAILDGSRWLRLQQRNGHPQGDRIELAFEPARPLKYADLDGDGEPEILALGPISAAAPRLLAAFSSATGKTLWTATVPVDSPQRNTADVAEWPWLVDVDGDNRSELIVPDSGPLTPAGGYRGMKMIDGASGRTRWVRPMRPDNKNDDGLNHVIQAPDLDGDGLDDLIAVSIFEGRTVPPPSRLRDRSEPVRAYVDAISGRDGRLLWSWHVDLLEDKFAHVWPPRWWGAGPDSRPLLAVPLGGQDPGQPGGPGYSLNYHPAAVHVLEASTGRERHRIAAMSRIGVADLDGDGLMDLWGEADGQLRAFRGELPEIWRSAAQFTPASNSVGMSAWNNGRPAVDFDGDGTGDALTAGPNWSGDSGLYHFSSSRTAIARSGRDGRLLWKTVLDPPRFPFDRDPARSYKMTAFPLPAGDLDGDGAPDVIVTKNEYDNELKLARGPASPAIQALSGRTGRHLWSAGPLSLPFESHGDSPVSWFRSFATVPNAPPDLLVLHRCTLVKATRAPPLAWSPGQDRLARISGRTGRVLWDIAVEEQPSIQQPGATRSIAPMLADVDGDGSTDAVLPVKRGLTDGPSEFDLKVISLGDGVTRWSRELNHNQTMDGAPDVEIGEGQPGHPAIIYEMEQPNNHNGNAPVLNALDGRDGSLLWMWSSSIAEGTDRRAGYFSLSNIDGTTKNAVYATSYNQLRECRVEILDSRGRECARRVIPPEPVPTVYYPPVCVYPVDLDGDGRDEVVVWNNNQLSGWSRDMKTLWSMTLKSWPLGSYLPGSPGRPCTLFIDSTTAIDGSTGELRWTEKSPTWMNKSLLDPGDSARRPLMLSDRRGPTVCRQALPLTARGEYSMPPGRVVPKGLIVDDPRWVRPLPWIDPMRQFAAPTRVFAVVALALVNVFLPIAIFRLAAGRQTWRVRTLMVLPVVVAIPLWTFQAIEGLLPRQIGAVPISPGMAFVVGTMAGIPIVTLIGFVGACVVRLRWKHLLGLAGLTLAGAMFIADLWLRSDSRAMPLIEHYDRSGWPVCILVGAYVVGVMRLIGWTLGRSYRWLRRSRVP